MLGIFQYYKVHFGLLTDSKWSDVPIKLKLTWFSLNKPDQLCPNAQENAEEHAQWSDAPTYLT
jgi:hypothetical protein